MWSLIVGFFLPIVIAFIIQTGWSQRLQAVAAFAVAAVAAAGTVYFQGELTGKRFIEAGLLILVTAIATYKGFWKPTGIAPGIETKTNLNDGS
jgi:VIT1/CCC1 family predicted Fe2+/Mn2+ transporter